MTVPTVNFSYPSLEEPKPPAAPEPEPMVQVNGRAADEGPLHEPAAPELSTVAPAVLDGPAPTAAERTNKATPQSQTGVTVKPIPQVKTLTTVCVDLFC